MLKRTLSGLFKGLLIGGLLALLLTKGLGVVTFGAVLAYAFAVLTGALTGLVAGKPIWARDARIEAALKAIAGALLAAGMMFALRRWAGYSIDLQALGAGTGVVGDLPLVSLPVISTVLAMAFDLDNTPGGDEAAKSRPVGGRRQRVAESPDRAAAEAELEALDEAAGARQERSRHH
jgi:hypothetical protein